MRSLILIGLLSFTQIVNAQQDSTKRLNIGGLAVIRTMQTQNEGELTDFYTTVAHAHLDVEYRLVPWLKLNASGYGVVNFGLNGLRKIDPTTLNGPAYEANLWNPIWMQGETHFQFAVANAELDFKAHKVVIGRYLFTSPFINPEPWPFPDASEGIFYHYGKGGRLSVEAALITRIAPRFNARFDDIGNSIGRGGIGFGVDGHLSRYSGNVQSDFVSVVGFDWIIDPNWELSAWNQYVDNVMNNVLVEMIHQMGNGWSASGMFIQQFKVNDGGNPDPSLTYLPDDKASYLGLRVNKIRGANSFQLNYARFFDQGRLQLTRDWGLEPFYTFQRRTRLEGIRDAHSLMFKWQRFIKSDKGVYRYVSSISRNWLPFPGDYEKSKYRLPSHAHVDFSLKYTSTSLLKGLSAEVYLAYRFLSEDIGTEYRYLINRANFFHSDLILSYNF